MFAIPHPSHDSYGPLPTATGSMGGYRVAEAVVRVELSLRGGGVFFLAAWRWNRATWTLFREPVADHNDKVTVHPSATRFAPPTDSIRHARSYASGRPPEA
jgi:hypothetical protein